MKCKFLKVDGTQCKANAVHQSEYCFTHDPEHKEDKQEAVKKGGLNRKTYLSPDKPIKIKSISDIQALLAATIEGVWIGQIPANQPANTIGFLCRCYVDVYEKVEIERKVSELETKVEDLVNSKR